MTDNTHPEALRIAHIFDHPIPPDWPDMVAAAAELRRQHARIAELEAQLEAVGAGGVQALSAAPAGWKLVPVKPDTSMQIAAKKADMDHSPLPDWLVSDWPEFLRIWNAMLAASPTPTPPALSAAPAGFVPVAAFDRLHAHAESLAARLLAAEQAALKASPSDIAKLRHLYANLKNGGVRDTAQAKRIADGLLAPIIERLEQAAPKAVPAAVGHDEDLLEKLYWEFDSQRKKTGEDRLAFKVKMRFYASEFLRRSDGKMTFAQSVSDDMMNLADRLGSEFDDVDPRAWKHLLVYAPKAAPGEPSDAEIDAFLDSPAGITWVIASNRERYRLFVRAVLAKWAAPQQAAPKAAPGKRLTREQIREVFMANGFTVKEGQTDLKQYVYDAAHALLELVAAPQQEAQEPAFVDVSLRTAIAKAVYQQVRVEFDYRLCSWTALDADEQQRIVDSIRGLYTAPQPAPAPLSDDTKRLAWMADEWTPGHEKLYDKHVLETGGVGGLDDLRTFIDKQIAAQGGKA